MSDKTFFETGEELTRWIAEKSDTAILSFSRGKDSLASYVAIREHFKTVVPVYMYRVPGLSFVEESLAYYEEVIGRHIIRLPHPSTYRQLRNMIFQAPQNRRVVEEFDVPKFDYDDVFRVVREDENLDKNTYVAIGVRASDNPLRALSIKKSGPINHRRCQFFPIFDWSTNRVVEEIENAGIRLPPDYELFGRSFDGINYQFLKPIRDNLPDDYARILEFFPMAELELKRMEFRNDYYCEVANV